MRTQQLNRYRIGCTLVDTQYSGKGAVLVCVRVEWGHRSFAMGYAGLKAGSQGSEHHVVVVDQSYLDQGCVVCVLCATGMRIVMRTGGGER